MKIYDSATMIKTALCQRFVNLGQLSRNGTPIKNGQLINLNISTDCNVKASSIARGNNQYKKTKRNSKIPGIPDLLYVRKKRGNVRWKKGAISIPAAPKIGICICI